MRERHPHRKRTPEKPAPEASQKPEGIYLDSGDLAVIYFLAAHHFWMNVTDRVTPDDDFADEAELTLEALAEVAMEARDYRPHGPLEDAAFRYYGWVPTSEKDKQPEE